jgi:tRNA (guanine37-N1)-methyltransferase
MIIDVLTLFPEIFSFLYNYSIIGKALENDKFILNTINIRDFSKDKHKRVDDYPYGGGPGMIL